MAEHQMTLRGAEDDPVPVQSLTELLEWINTYYNLAAAALAGEEQPDIDAILNNELSVYYDVLDHVQQFARSDMAGRAYAHYRTRRDLKIKRISFNSPWEIVFEGILPVLALVAVIVSGGKLKVTGILEVQLPPLGDGIAALRKALAAAYSPHVRPRRPPGKSSPNVGPPSSSGKSSPTGN